MPAMLWINKTKYKYYKAFIPFFIKSIIQEKQIRAPIYCV